MVEFVFNVSEGLLAASTFKGYYMNVHPQLVCKTNFIFLTLMFYFIYFILATIQVFVVTTYLK